MKTIAINVFHSFVARNLLYGDMLTTLRRSGLHVVLLVPQQKKGYFEELFVGQDVTVEGVAIEAIANSPRHLLFQRFSFLLIRSHYLWYKRVERRDASGSVLSWIKFGAEQLFLALCGGRRFVQDIYRSLFVRYANTSELETILARLSPSLVFVTDLFNPADYLVLRAAQKLNIPDIAMVRSWDNCYSKGLLPVLPSRLLTNTYLLKEEAASIHHVPSDHIEVVGLPQFDASFSETPADRDTYFRKLGIDPSKKLIVLAPGGTVLTDIDWQYCEILDEAIKSGAIRHPVHVLVRNHPNHPADLSRFEGSPHFTIEYPGRKFGENPKETELTPADQKYLRDTLANADVLLWVATTLGIDASVYDTPQIMINFDGMETRPYAHSVRKYSDEDHMKKLVATGGAHLARSKEELIEWINAYLSDPRLDAEKRKQLTDSQLVFTDGRSGERVTRALISLVQASSI